MAKKEKTGKSFEDALKRLEEVLESLEHGELNLEESVQAFEEGVGLVRFCHDKLPCMNELKIVSKNVFLSRVIQSIIHHGG